MTKRRFKLCEYCKEPLEPKRVKWCTLCAEWMHRVKDNLNPKVRERKREWYYRNKLEHKNG